MIQVSKRWKAAFPDSHTGFLVMQGATNPVRHPDLERIKRDLEAELRGRLAQYDRKALEAHSVMPAYCAYYKRFKKTYHVLAQLESVVLKGRSLPSVAALVEAMFMAEIKNLILTAGHDLDRVSTPVIVDVATGSESYTGLRGQEQVLKAGDMFMADQSAVISSIVHGPDQRTQITSDTQNVMFAAYAPAGVGQSAVLSHLRDIRDYVRVVSPNAKVKLLAVFEGKA
jgi:DNA/RNA-binding domain of Phe-tRNA-synthetase-like protein